MELYLAASGVANPTHDVFYTNEKVIASYRECLDLLCSLWLTSFHREICEDNRAALQKLAKHFCVGAHE